MSELPQRRNSTEECVSSDGLIVHFGYLAREVVSLLSYVCFRPIAKRFMRFGHPLRYVHQPNAYLSHYHSPLNEFV